MVCARKGEAFSLLLAEMRCTSSRSQLQITSSKNGIVGTDFKASSAVKGKRLISFTTIIFIADCDESHVVKNISPYVRGMVEDTQSLVNIPSYKYVGWCRPPKMRLRCQRTRMKYKRTLRTLVIAARGYSQQVLSSIDCVHYSQGTLD